MNRHTSWRIEWGPVVLEWSDAGAWRVTRGRDVLYHGPDPGVAMWHAVEAGAPTTGPLEPPTG